MWGFSLLFGDWPKLCWLRLKFINYFFGSLFWRWCRVRFITFLFSGLIWLLSTLISFWLKFWKWFRDFLRFFIYDLLELCLDQLFKKLFLRNLILLIIRLFNLICIIIIIINGLLYFLNLVSWFCSFSISLLLSNFVEDEAASIVTQYFGIMCNFRCVMLSILDRHFCFFESIFDRFFRAWLFLSVFFLFGLLLFWFFGVFALDCLIHN